MRIPASPYARYTAPAPTAPAAGKAPAAGPASPASPVAKPIETATELRQVLTAEEQRFFDDAASLGPVWYGRNGAGSTPPAPSLGQRLDVRG